MESTLLLGSSTQLHLPKLRTHKKPRASSFITTICCGLRRSARKPLWRSTFMSTEAIQAVQALKLAKTSPVKHSSRSSSTKIVEVFSNKIERLLKPDLVAVLGELQRQNEWEIALQVFNFMQKEVSLKPDLSLYGDMILMLGKNQLIEVAEQIFSELKQDGLQPDTRVYTEMIGAYLKVGMVDAAVNLYNAMKDSGCNPDRLTLAILIRNLDKAGEEDLATAVRNDCEKFVEYPERFLEEVSKTYPKRRLFKVV